MDTGNKMNRRTMLKSGLTILTTSALAPHRLLAAPKKAGEVRVLILAGDYWHNGIMYERHWRRILGVTGWKIIFAQSSKFVTPEVLDQTDLFIFVRWAGGDSIAWSPEGIVEKRPENSVWMTPEHEESIVENVTKRGMGIIPMHCSLWSPNARKFMDLMGVEEPLMHGPMIRTRFYDFNSDHPVSQGIEPFVEVDEIFGTKMMDVPYTPLYRAEQSFELIKKETGGHIKFYEEQEDSVTPLDRLAGWSREVDAGRVVVLNNGSFQTVFYKKGMKELMWRSAHWAMHMDIPESGLIEGRSKDRA